MKVELVKPQGYCSGVRNAINLACKAKEENHNAPIFVLGALVHNKIVIDELERKGINTYFGEDYETFISSLRKGDVLIFTAHGHDEKLTELAKEKGLIIYDSTCPIVKNNLDKIRKEIESNHQVIYVGQSGHKETEASLSISKNVSLYDTKLLINYQLITDESPFVANQTTLNFLELKDIHNDILSHFPKARIENEICPASRLRQEALLKLDEDIDLIIIVGDKSSSNSKKLFDIASRRYPKALVLMVLSLKDLLQYDFSYKKKAAISSGASTPPHVVEEIYDYLLKV